MANSSPIGARFEKATRELFKQLFPLLGFEVIAGEPRHSGSQSGYDVRFQTRPLGGTKYLKVNFFIECKGAGEINTLPPGEFKGKPDQLDKTTFNPDYWILISPLRYKNNDFQELLDTWKNNFPFAFVDWVRESKEETEAGLYLDLYKHFPDAYRHFKDDVPENIRETAPSYPLDEILAYLKTSLNNAYDECQERVLQRGIVPGVKRITPQAIYKAGEADADRLNYIRTRYYMLDSERFVWKAVCNDLDVRNENLNEQLKRVVEKAEDSSATFWVLGAPGCGKTTQMHRTAIDCAAARFPVLLINSLRLSENTNLADYDRYFRLIHHLHNTAFEKDETKPLLVFIDNPKARIETVTNLLRHFDSVSDAENFKCVFLLFEREIRYRQAEEDSFLVDFVGGNHQKILIENENNFFKEKIFASFVEALNLPATDLNLARRAFFDDPRTSVAEAIINFCKTTRNDKYKRIAMDWVDFEKVAHERQWGSLKDLYKWTSLLYQFGIALPESLLAKVLDDYSKNEFYNLKDFFDNQAYENLPLILEGDTFRTRHELIASWYVEEKLGRSVNERLTDFLKVIDVQNDLERSVFIALLGRKNTIKKYFAHLSAADFEAIQQKGAEHPVSHRLALMASSWHFLFNGDFAKARETFKSVLAKYPNSLPIILETAKLEFRLGNKSEAEQLLLRLLSLDSRNLHARTELAKIYQIQKRYEEAEQILLKCIEISPNDLNSRTELAKIYQTQKRYNEAKQILLKCIEISPNDLNSRTELAKVYQAQKRYQEAEQILLKSLEIDINQLHPRTELAKIYQIQKRYKEAEQILLEALEIDINQLHPRTELAKIYQIQKRYKEAEQILLDLLNLDSQNLQARTELAKIYQTQKRYEEAEQILLDLLNLDSQNLQARTELAKIYQTQKRYEEAEQILLESLEIDINQTHPRTELAKIYQAQKRYEEAEQILLESLEIDINQTHPRTELAKIYQIQERYEEAEQILLEALEIDINQIHPRSELARIYTSLGLFRKARSIAFGFMNENRTVDWDVAAYLILAYLNACFRMRRFQEGVDFVDRLGCQLLSAELAEEYGRLLEFCNFRDAVMFFQTAARMFKNSSRLLSEAAVCFKLDGRSEADAVLEAAIRLKPDKENKYRRIYGDARMPRRSNIRERDFTGFITEIDCAGMRGTIKKENTAYPFRWQPRYERTFGKLKTGDEVFFDVTFSGDVVNVEPVF